MLHLFNPQLQFSFLPQLFHHLNKTTLFFPQFSERLNLLHDYHELPFSLSDNQKTQTKHDTFPSPFPGFLPSAQSHRLLPAITWHVLLPFFNLPCNIFITFFSSLFLLLSLPPWHLSGEKIRNYQHIPIAFSLRGFNMSKEKGNN